MYTPTGEAFTIDTSGLKGDIINATWLNPLNGEKLSVAGVFDEDVADFEPPASDDHLDWTLVLEKKCS